MIPAEAFMMDLGPVVIKAKEEGGKRTVEVQASDQSVDSEGDVVLQNALLASADSFVKSGHLDIDHLSEIGARVGIPDPTSYIVGRPVEVKDLGGKKTGVVGEIMRSKEGIFDTAKNRFDAFWKSLQSDPPVQWSASIYGYPTEVDDCTSKSCPSGATRYVIKALDWRSLAFTRNPINRSLTGYAKVVTAKAMIDEIKKEGLAPPFGLNEMGQPGMPLQGAMGCGGMLPSCMDHAWGQYIRSRGSCSHMKGGNSVLAFKNHYMQCCGASPEHADILGHALMYAVLRDKKLSRHK